MFWKHRRRSDWQLALSSALVGCARCAAAARLCRPWFVHGGIEIRGGCMYGDFNFVVLHSKANQCFYIPLMAIAPTFYMVWPFEFLDVPPEDCKYSPKFRVW